MLGTRPGLDGKLADPYRCGRLSICIEIAPIICSLQAAGVLLGEIEYSSCPVDKRDAELNICGWCDRRKRLVNASKREKDTENRRYGLQRKAKTTDMFDERNYTMPFPSLWKMHLAGLSPGERGESFSGGDSDASETSRLWEGVESQSVDHRLRRRQF